ADGTALDRVWESRSPPDNYCEEALQLMLEGLFALRGKLVVARTANVEPMATTRIGIDINAPRATVYRLLLDGDAVIGWMMPDGVSPEVHRFEPREGGSFSITLAGATTGAAELPHDAYYGRFLSLVPDEQVVEVLEFVTEQDEMTGTQTITFTLSDTGTGTHLDSVHEGVPPGLSAADNDEHWQMALAKLKSMAEQRLR
ncbi:SRPBCC domain-containing protein, partial [Nocardia halotolerans]